MGKVGEAVPALELELVAAVAGRAEGIEKTIAAIEHQTTLQCRRQPQGKPRDEEGGKCQQNWGEGARKTFRAEMFSNTTNALEASENDWWVVYSDSRSLFTMVVRSAQ